MPIIVPISLAGIAVAAIPVWLAVPGIGLAIMAGSGAAALVTLLFV